ncbi:MAG: 3'(2'),5'-bisphosphate nucleotidase [Verrucomicrobia bacterium]|jgi:3'(2'), 5'-bisphosphate nucleotidase|nr:3'(2'),5'-bisphosphate nucleotidase [Verrucomicrobiota bacterium]MBT7068370.1 3'(2'),5'-bisphosphate nucleotidase [Verrucomicrobiota bacterium]MBT7701231.1 3'(2'),5'-bisphosphate nucleotidase [Verrucomicrobiota bacterium]
MFEPEMKVAVEAVRKASALCQHVRATLVTDETITKQDRSPVTIADLAAQAVMSQILLEAFPDDPLVAEEDTALLQQEKHGDNRQRVFEQVRRILPGLDDAAILAAIDRGNHPGGASGRFWTMDPIDGTKGYIRGDQYAVALALIEDGEVVLGVMGCPHLPQGTMNNTTARGVIMAACRGGGAVSMPLEGETATPLRVANATRGDESVLCESVEAAHTAHGRSAQIAARLGVHLDPVRIDSQCKYAIVARGEATTYLRLPRAGSTYEEKIWDHAAGVIVVTEAGGSVSDTRGAPLDFSLGRTLRNNTGVTATNGALHAMVVDALAATQP